MPFGLSCAPEIFQIAIDNLFENFCDVHPYFNDIIIHSESVDEHYIKLKTVLCGAGQKGLKFNRDKMQTVSKQKYLSHIISPARLSLDC